MDYYQPQPEDDGQAAMHAAMLVRFAEEEKALLRVMQGKATVEDAEILAHATGHDWRQLLKEAA